MKQIIKVLVTSFVFTAGLTACANLTEKQNQIDSVVISQLEVLKKTKSLREQVDMKARISKDAVLVEKEKLLMDALTSVIESQEAYLKLKNKL